MNGEDNNVINTAPAAQYQRQCDVTSEYSVFDRSPAAVRQRVIADLRQRIRAITPSSAAFDTDELEHCEDVRRLAELLKLRLASVSPRLDETSVDKSSGLVTVNEAINTDRQVPVPMYRQDSHGRLTISHYIDVTRHSSRS